MLIVANHISWLDIFVLNALQPARFIAKAELQRWPVVGRLIANAGTLFIERERRRDTHTVNRHTVEALARGDVVAVFPEGTTSDGTGLLKFHSSLLQPIVDAGGPRAADRDPLPHAGGRAQRRAGLRRRDDASCESFWRVTGERALVAELHLMPPLAAAGAHRRELSRAAAEGYPNGFGVTGARAGTWNTRRSSSLTAVSVPPHRQPESSISRFGASLQLERRPVAADDRLAGRRAVLVLEPRPEALRRDAAARAFP